ncbi:MAG TPA: hypothetical protein VM658_14275 [bacterium]|nr:hypothetical protein [bacterium]
MTTDAELLHKGFKALLDSLGELEAERFIALLQREPFDYTEWQRSLWINKTVEQISGAARAFRKEQASRGKT